MQITRARVGRHRAVHLDASPVPERPPLPRRLRRDERRPARVPGHRSAGRGGQAARPERAGHRARRGRAAHQRQRLGRQPHRAPRLPGEERSTAVGPAQNAPGRAKEKVRVEYQLLAPSTCPASTTATAVTAPTSCSASASGERRRVMGRRAWIALATAALLHTFAAPGAARPDGHGRRAFLVPSTAGATGARGDRRPQRASPLARRGPRRPGAPVEARVVLRHPGGRDPDARRRCPAAVRTHPAVCSSERFRGRHVGHRPRRRRCRRRPRHRRRGCPDASGPGRAGSR